MPMCGGDSRPSSSHPLQKNTTALCLRLTGTCVGNTSTISRCSPLPKNNKNPLFPFQFPSEVLIYLLSSLTCLLISNTVQSTFVGQPRIPICLYMIIIIIISVGVTHYKSNAIAVIYCFQQQCINITCYIQDFSNIIAAMSSNHQCYHKILW